MALTANYATYFTYAFAYAMAPTANYATYFTYILNYFTYRFAPFNRGLRCDSRPTGFPHAHPRISNILGHGLGQSLWPLAVGLWILPWAMAQAWPQLEAMTMAGVMA